MTHKSWDSYLESTLELGFWDGDSDKSKKHKSFHLPGAKPHYNPDRPGQVEHIALDLVLDIPQQAIAGTCKIRLRPVRDGVTDLILDAVDLRIDRVNVSSQIEAKPDLDKTKCKFDYDGEVLKIYLNEPTQADVPIEIAIAYAAEQPQRGIYFVKPTEHQPNKPTQVWTQGEDEDSRYWFPCFDYPGQLATSERIDRDFKWGID
jgi:aminopeptidase N